MRPFVVPLYIFPNRYDLEPDVVVQIGALGFVPAAPPAAARRRAASVAEGGGPPAAAAEAVALGRRLAATAATSAHELQFAAELPEHDLGRVLLLPILALPLAG